VWSERRINIANGNPQIVFNLANIHWKVEWSVLSNQWLMIEIFSWTTEYDILLDIFPRDRK